MQSTLYFYGAAGSVTGSHFLLEIGSPSTSLGTTSTKLLVDCGLRQGMGEEHNWDPFPYNPAEVSHLLVTHAHLDHVGRIPFLVKNGFKGEIISTKATRALAEPMLYDALEILQHNAKHNGRPELYGEQDVESTLRLWRGVDYHDKIALSGEVEAQLYDAGHILGSAMVVLGRAGRAIVFTGDVGGGNSPLLAPTEELPVVNYVVLEGTYGDKLRPEDPDRLEKLEDVIEDTAARGGTLVVPAFSTERTQDLLFDIRRLMLEKRVPLMPVYLDSPLAEKITEAYLQYPNYFAPKIAKRVEDGEKIFSFPELHYVSTREESQALNAKEGSKIILAGSGMSSGGRVFSHERAYLPDPNSTVLIVGYQAAGTTGRQLIEGSKTIKVRSGNEVVEVRAHVEQLYGYSAHRDGEGLLDFANQAATQHAEEIFVVHGEPQATMFLAQRIRDYLGTKATAPEAGSAVQLDF